MSSNGGADIARLNGVRSTSRGLATSWGRGGSTLISGRRSCRRGGSNTPINTTVVVARWGGGGGGGSRRAAPGGGGELGLTDHLHVRTSIGKLDVGALRRAAVIADVGDEHVGVAREVVGATAGDGDRGAVHVHLAVAGVVEPGPGEDGIAGFGVGGDGEVEGLVAARLVDAAALDRLDDLEGLSAVVRNRELAGTTFVRRAAGEAELLLAACRPGGRRRTSGSSEVLEVTLAGEVTSCSQERGGHAEVLVLRVLVQLRAEGDGWMNKVSEGNKRRIGGYSRLVISMWA